MSVVDQNSIRELYFTYLGMSQNRIVFNKKKIKLFKNNTENSGRSFYFQWQMNCLQHWFFPNYETFKVFFIFIGLKAYFSISELRKAAHPAKQFLSPPEFGEKDNKTISCDLSQKVVLTRIGKSGELLDYDRLHAKKFCLFPHYARLLCIL